MQSSNKGLVQFNWEVLLEKNQHVTIHGSRCLFQVAFQSYAKHHREKGAISTNYECR